MLTLRPAADRGTTNFGWLDSRHTFSFGDYYDPDHHHFRALRVINDDRIAAGAGFPTHPHRDMEILTFVLRGAIQHRDSMGNGSVVKAGEWQYMSAGTGVAHSEFNPSETHPTHLLQIWIVPDKKGYAPRYAQKSFADAPPGRWVPVATPDGRDGTMAIRQDVVLSTAKLRPGDEVRYDFRPGRGGWLHLATGTATVNGLSLIAGDGLAIIDEAAITVTGDGEAILFDLA
jgi:quercetin 2,3-dioxygenase